MAEMDAGGKLTSNPVCFGHQVGWKINIFLLENCQYLKMLHNPIGNPIYSRRKILELKSLYQNSSIEYIFLHGNKHNVTPKS